MGKKKVVVKLIQNPTSRHSSFYKRKGGLLKKAFELSVLCDAEVALIIFSETGKIYEFASHDDVATILAKYSIQSGTTTNATPSSLQKTELERLHEKINMLEKRKKNMDGENLESLTVKELQQLEKKLRKSIRRICDRKMNVFSQCSKLLLHELGTRGHSSTSAVELSQISHTRGYSSTSGAELSSDEISSS